MDELLRHDLEKAGWYPGRKIDITQHCENMHKACRPLPDVVRSFLEEFAGLTVERLAPASSEVIDRVKIFLYVPDRPGDDYELNCLGTTLGSPVLIVGFHENSGTNILMDTSGRVFEAIDGYLWRIGDTPIDGLSAMLSYESKPLERYDEDYLEWGAS